MLKEVPEPLRLTDLAEFLEVETFTGSFRELILPLLAEHPATAPLVAQLEALSIRYCHPRPRCLAWELETAEASLDVLLASEMPVAVLLEAEEIRNSWVLCMRLLEASMDVASDDPGHGRHLAEYARDLAQRLPEASIPVEQRQQLESLAWAHIGNAWRIPGELQRASSSFGKAESLLKAGANSGLAAASLALEACLLRDQRKLNDARLAIKRALQLDAKRPRTRTQVGCLMNLASLAYEAGDPQAALRHTRKAMRDLTPETYPRWYAEAVNNEAFFLSCCGEPTAALARLSEHRSTLERHGSRADLCRADWCTAAALRQLGRFDEAVSRYETSRRGFGELGRDLHAAVVTLELATLHLEQGEMAAVKQLALKALPELNKEGLNREAQATLELFRQAVLAETVQLAQVRQWLEHLGSRRRE